MIGELTGGKAIPVEVLDQIVAKTDGVPLFVEELDQDGARERACCPGANGRYELSGPLTAVAIPSTLQDSLMARLDRLAPVREVAQIGACIGREFPLRAARLGLADCRSRSCTRRSSSWRAPS